ncbi:hypothetical protein CDL60_18275 [Roseateles noduli]|nr:hypothetical protein CDL60_18275 [Roseateles noduli]
MPVLLLACTVRFGGTVLTGVELGGASRFAPDRPLAFQPVRFGGEARGARRDGRVDAGLALKFAVAGGQGGESSREVAALFQCLLGTGVEVLEFPRVGVVAGRVCMIRAARFRM